MNRVSVPETCAEGRAARRRGAGVTRSSPGGRDAARRREEDVMMGAAVALLWLFTGFLQGAHGQGVYGETSLTRLHGG